MFKIKFYPSQKKITQACLWYLWQTPGLYWGTLCQSFNSLAIRLVSRALKDPKGRPSLHEFVLTDLVEPGLFYKHLCHSFIHWLIEWYFCSESPRHCLSQTVRAEQMKLLENVYLPPCVACHVSHVTCQMSDFFDQVVKLVVGGSVIKV